MKSSTNRNTRGTKVPRWLIVLIILLVFLGGYLGFVKHLEIPNVIQIDFRESQNRICIPWKTKAVPHSTSVSINKKGGGEFQGDWKTQGGDGHGGTLLSYDVKVNGVISNVAVESCVGCGGHFWLCPDARCNGRKTFEPIDQSTWRAWAATDGEPGATTVFRINYTTEESFCFF